MDTNSLEEQSNDGMSKQDNESCKWVIEVVREHRNKTKSTLSWQLGNSWADEDKVMWAKAPEEPQNRPCGEILHVKYEQWN